MTVAVEIDRAETTVLIVEDRALESGPVRALFRNGTAREFELHGATGTMEAAGRLAARTFDVVLYVVSWFSDHAVAGLRTLRAAAPGTPIVVLTWSDDQQQTRLALREGAHDVLVRGSLSRELLTRSLHHAVERQAAADELARITESLREANRRLEELSALDPLTGLLNRRGFEQQLEHERLWVSRGEGDLLAVMVDLDDFKSVNDTLGHAAGDRVLAEVAARLRGALRATDAVARIGGDEFLVLLPRTRPAEGRRVAEKLRVALSGQPVRLGPGSETTVTASLAVVQVEDAQFSLDTLLAETHQGLYNSKRLGKNRVSHAGGEDPLVGGLRSGDALRVVRQPVVQLATGDPVGFEFLARTHYPGFEEPAAFFPVAREADILAAVDLHCFRAGLAASVDVAAGRRCFLNLLPNTLAAQPVERLLELFPADWSLRSYCIEVSEQQIVGDPTYLEPAVAALRRAGLLFAIDDVGFGRSSLESLILLEPDIVKIDRRCVTGLAESPSRARKLAHLARIVEASGAAVIAVGVETRDDAEALVSLGIGLGQGFYLAPPG